MNQTEKAMAGSVCSLHARVGRGEVSMKRFNIRAKGAQHPASVADSVPKPRQRDSSLILCHTFHQFLLHLLEQEVKFVASMATRKTLKADQFQTK